MSLINMASVVCRIGKGLRQFSCMHQMVGCVLRCHVMYLHGSRIPVQICKQTTALTPCASSEYLKHVRSVSFVGKVTAEELWGGVFGVSNAGRKRGRAKHGRNKINLNKGQVIGLGKNNIVWPGLNAPVIKGREVLSIKELPPDPERETKIQEARDRTTHFRTFTVPALQRGWTGGKLGGTSIGPPDPVGDYTFEGFDTRILEFKLVTNMTGNLGRKQRFSSFVVTGNKNGLAGFALAKAPNAKASLRKAKNMAAKRLQFIERYNDHTVFHNFYSKEGQTAVYAFKAAEGSGLVCHRALKTICEIIGIKDLSAKVEGSTSNIQNLTKAFFRGLLQQETHQDLANRMKLNVVEFRPEMEGIPLLVAAPEEGKTREEGIKEDDFSFENFYFGGRVPLYRPKREPFFKKFRSWKIKYRWIMKTRDQKKAQLERIALGLEPSPEEKKLRARPLK